MAASAKNPEKVLRAMGTTFMSLTMGNFKASEHAGLRPTPPGQRKKTGRPRRFKKSGLSEPQFSSHGQQHWASTLANPMIYAAIHQFGARDYDGKKGIPPRPYFPVDASGKLTPKAYDLIANAGHRALAREIKGGVGRASASSRNGNAYRSASSHHFGHEWKLRIPPKR